MSYVESQLLAGESIRYRAHLHKILFVPSFLVAALALLAALISFAGTDIWPVAAGLGVVALGMFLWELILYTGSEFAVTDRRVIIKVGWIQRRTLETMLGKVEALGVEQGLLGRLLGYGTITVTGTGGTQETFDRIASPLEFRKRVQAEAMAADDRRVQALPPSPLAVNAAGIPAPREERECPYCAERVLARARVCRFCGRDLPPVPAG